MALEYLCSISRSFDYNHLDTWVMRVHLNETTLTIFSHFVPRLLIFVVNLKNEVVDIFITGFFFFFVFRHQRRKFIT